MEVAREDEREERDDEELEVERLLGRNPLADYAEDGLQDDDVIFGDGVDVDRQSLAYADEVATKLSSRRCGL